MQLSFMRGSHNMESIFQVSVHFPSCWFLQRVTHCSACSSISDISRSNAIIFHRIWGSLSLPSLSLVPLQAVGPCSALLPSLAGFILPSVSGSCLGPTLASLPAGTRGCCLRPSRAPSTGGGWPGVFRGIMRLIMSGDSLPRYPCHPEHRARIRLPIKTLSLIRKTNGHELLWKSWYLAFLPNVFVFSPDTNWQQLLWWMWKMGESTVFCNKWNKYLMIVSFPHV